MTVARASTSLSKFAFSDLALRSAVELEKARVGTSYEIEPIQSLADVLGLAANPDVQGAPFKFVEPGYYQTFERLYHTKQPAPVESVEQIQKFMSEAIDRLRSIKSATDRANIDKELIAFCIALHRELIRGLSTEDKVVVQERRSPDFSTPTGFS